MGGPAQDRYNALVGNIDGQIGAYLNGEEIKNILTPGEFSEWPLKLKAGQVVIAEARSDAFDPALEVVDSTGKVMDSNDDRYPGDQRPLLLWRCQTDGAYHLRVRCFLNKAGGQFFVRFNIYDTLDLKPDAMSEASWDKPTSFLLHLQMKAGDIRQIVRERPNGEYINADWSNAISPTGLPDINLTRPLDGALPNAIMAAVPGDYYVLANYSGGGKHKIRVGLRTISAEPLKDENGVLVGSAQAGKGALWTVAVKKGQLLEVAVPALNLNAAIVASRVPDISKYDLSKPETNPFTPEAAPKERSKEPYVEMPARARDFRRNVFLITQDATLWLATNGAGPEGKPYTLEVKPAAKPLPGPESAKLRIGNTDYWSFQGSVGDALSFKTAAVDFAENVVVFDPDMNNIYSTEADPDQDSLAWNLTAVKSGRYTIAVSSIGDGGGGTYSIDRKVTPAKEFAIGDPATGEMTKDGQLQVWKFSVKPDEPVLMRWKSTEWNYSISVHDNRGRDFNLRLTAVDGNTKFGIIKVAEPTSILIVLNTKGNAKYSIDLSDLPGYGKGK